MKNLIWLSAYLIISAIFSSCSKDDENTSIIPEGEKTNVNVSLNIAPINAGSLGLGQPDAAAPQEAAPPVAEPPPPPAQPPKPPVQETVSLPEPAAAMLRQAGSGRETVNS